MDSETAYRAAYGVYEWLRDNPQVEGSGTSRNLKFPDFALFGRRLSDELDEVRGVLEGRHAHTGDLKNDFVTEAHQAWYWLALADVATGLQYDRVMPHAHAESGYESSDADYPFINTTGTQELIGTTERCMRFIGGMCRRAGVSTGDIAVYDLEEMKERAYLHEALKEAGYL
ncbi:MAG: hypothetical protein DRO99_03100 [Candidatus Aenigmatarchaeota archaeon]|nr:MAG: hypothetical protein DRO99_03100 [Candidatus Aenigmarchaeota archaeon]